MARFDVYSMPGRGRAGYLLDVQADLLQDLSTRVVVPLLPPDTAPKQARDLNPSFDINGQPHLMLTQFIAAVPKRELLKPRLSLRERSDEIARALDLLLIGF
jgi:toxin CcdB